MATIAFSGAAFRYKSRDHYVIHEFDLVVPRGRTILLGPNGAGKSTILGLAASVLALDRGRVAVDGIEPKGRRNLAAYRRRVSFMPQVTHAASGLTTREQVALHGWLAGMSRRDAWEQSAVALGQVNLADHASRRASRLSGGQRARMGLAQALVHSADVLLLDEPAAALDPDQREAFAALLANVSEGRTVVVSSHDVADLEKSFDRVVVVAQGRVAFSGTAAEFLHAGTVTLSPVEAYRAAVAAR